MATLRQAVEVQRQRGGIPPTGDVALRDLQQVFRPTPPGSTTALIRTMLARGAERKPWAVILCRLKDDPADAAREGPVEAFYREAFSPGSGGLVEYWRDVSLGAIDISGSRVFGWVELEIDRAHAGIGSGTNRSTFVDNAIKVLLDRHDPGADPVTGFHSQIAVLTRNWAKDGAPPGADWRTPGWSPFWIDGSADGRGKVTLTPPHDGNVTAHEMGHGFGLQHDVAADLVTHYGDPCCIMSQHHSFSHPRWNVRFGPAVCFPHLLQKGWLLPNRVLNDDGGWVSKGIAVQLASLSDPGARGSLGVRLPLKTLGWDYLLQYVRPAFWDQGLDGDTLFIRRLGPGKDVGETPVYLGSVGIPSAPGRRAQTTETSGKTTFQVERVDAGGRVIQVVAKKT